MNKKKEISLPVVILNCICAIVWSINLFVALVYGYTDFIGLVLYVICAVVWDFSAVVCIIRYLKSKKTSG